MLPELSYDKTSITPGPIILIATSAQVRANNKLTCLFRHELNSMLFGVEFTHRVASACATVAHLSEDQAIFAGSWHL
ncbi:Ankyrin-1 [Fusarium oxysporum f. sp. albedinis]|nr:Ankyrin-1 [Fusarium oxysporum f. sp. albedinis]